MNYKINLDILKKIIFNIIFLIQKEDFLLYNNQYLSYTLLYL